MLMAALSRRSGVPVATIKYYLREGALPPGDGRSASRAEYGEVHLRRLRLVRALLDIGEVPLATIRKILAVVDDQSASVHEMLGAVQYALGPHPAAPAEPDAEENQDWQAASRQVDELIASLGWIVAPAAPARTLLARTLAALRQTGIRPGRAGLRAYAEAMAGLAAGEVASLDALPPGGGPPGAPPEDDGRVALAESAVVGMVLHERVIVALRLLAQEDASARYFA